jgi:hypothetical protein
VSSRRERSSKGITLLGRRVLLPECADCEAAAYSVKGTGVNAERGMAHGSSTFEESRILGASVDGIGKTLSAIDFQVCLGLPPTLSMRPPSSAYLLLQW